MKRHSGMFKKGDDPRRKDLTELNKARAGIPRSPETKQKMSQAHQDSEMRENHREIVEWLTTNVVEPDLFVNEDGSNENLVNIWFMVMNYGQITAKENAENENRILRFLSYVSSYLPDELKNHEIYKFRIRDKDLVETFEHWLFESKQKLQNYLAREYFAKGRLKDLEILKRRYKENWSESKVVDLTADASMKVDGDSRLEIKIVDA